MCRYIGIQEKEFEWLTEQLVSLANKYCQGRIVSALEGGYRIQGGIVSAFARSVASHVRALSSPSQAEWSWADVQAEQQRERKRKVLLLCSHSCWGLTCMCAVAVRSNCAVSARICDTFVCDVVWQSQCHGVCCSVQLHVTYARDLPHHHF